MNKNMIVFILIMTIAFFFTNALAQINEVSKDQTTEKRCEWKYTNHPVTTDIEAAYDINQNGTLEPDETRNLLQERYDIIKTQGSTGVDVDLLQQYDANGDGEIDAREAEEIREDME